MSSSALQTPIPEPPPAPARQRKRLRPLARVAIALASVLVLLGLLGLVPNEPIRRAIEGKMNRSLKGYTARVGQARFQPLGFSLTLENVVIRQAAHPEPAILVVPTLHASVHWRELLFLRVVADFRIDQPRGYVNLPQLREEIADEVPVKDKGWQQAVEAIYPLKINLFRLFDGELTYIDEDPARPLKLTHVDLRATNIRNIHSKERTYPSPIEASAVVFGSGKADLKGRADFLAEPHAGVRGQFHLTGIPLDYFEPVVEHWNAVVSGGTLTAAGEIEFAPGVRRLSLPEITVERAKIGYVRKPPAAAEKGIVPTANRKAADNGGPRWELRLDRFRMADSELELIDRTRNPAYRLFVTRVSADVNGLATEPPGHTAQARAHGKFMDAGDVAASATFQPKARSADLNIKVEVKGTPMPKLNDLFRAYGKFDVYAGEFSLYSELRVHEGYMRGYVKPIFKDVEIYDRRQDAQKPLLKKVYEGVVDAASKILKNPGHDQVATSTSVEGPVGNAKSSTWEILGGLLENAFIKAILPGFDRQVGTLKRK